MEPWQLILLFCSCFFGGLAIFYFKSDTAKTLKLILSFSGAFLFAITVLHLIPEAYQSGDNTIGLFVLGGFLFQIVLEQYSEGVEHGHIHPPQGHGSILSVFPAGIMISLCIHAVLEGMPLAGTRRGELVFGIALHHIPAAFALATIMVQHKVSKSKIIFFLLMFSVMTPAGYFISKILSDSGNGLHFYFNKGMGFVIGIFLHISTTILFESSVDHHFNRKKLFAVLAGTAIALLSFFI